ncbi:MAG: tetratricopeptide repeat protein, partial [Vicinamibacteria bacterium]
WPDLLVSNDFGRKNLYHNEGMKNGKVTFKDVAAQAGVEDYGAGMSAAWLDYDNDGHLDIYTGNMWSAAGQRVTAEPGFMPNAAPEIRALYRRHARGNSLFRNRGDGTFEDVTLKAGAEFGRWAWSSGAIDFDNDGWEDLFVVNGMFTEDREDDEARDYDSFFWRQVVARSPLSDSPGTLYDDGWRAINRLLMADGEQASHERKVLLHNDGRGGFDEVSGSVGLDLDQDGRSFAVFDYDQDGKADVVLLAPRSSPQLRLFRNDFAEGNAALALRLTGTRSNRDAVGARVTVETDEGRHTKVVQAGSGFLSQHSKELLFGLGKSRRIVKVVVEWPSGLIQTLPELALNRRASVVEGSDAVRSEPFRKGAEQSAMPVRDAGVTGPATTGTWMYRPFPAPDFRLRDLGGREHALSALRGKPVLLLFWATGAPPSGVALKDLAQEGAALRAAGAQALAVSVDSSDDEPKVRAATQGLGLPVMVATEEVAGTYSIVSRYLFDRREDLRLPTLLLIDARGEIVKAYRDHVDLREVLADLPKIDAPPAERLARAVPFPGTFHAPPGERNDFPYALDLAEQGFDGPALAAFERAAKQARVPITFYNLGTLYMKGAQPSKARLAFERAVELKPDYADANNSLGALLAQGGEVPAAIERFRSALKAKPDFADALNNLGYALFQTGHPEEAAGLYLKALAAQPGFPEALNNLGILFGQQGDLERAEPYFMQAVEARPRYGEAANNLALVRNARGDAAGAVGVLQKLLQENPGFEAGYVTLARIYLEAGRRREGIQVLELLLQRNPSHAQGLQLLGQAKAVR